MNVKMSPLVVSIEFMVANKIVGYVNGMNGLIHSSNDSIRREYGTYNVCKWRYKDEALSQIYFYVFKYFKLSEKLHW